MTTATVAAQCETQWLPGMGCRGTDGYVDDSTMWDPDGAGPLAPELVVAGTFRLAGDAICSGVARCDLVTGTWRELGPAIFDRAGAVAIMPNGDLVVAGLLANTSAHAVARWNGAWSLLPGDFFGPIRALHVTANGDLYACGKFSHVGGQSINGVACWSGTSWVPLGSGIANSFSSIVNDMASLGNGDLIVGGSFDTAGGSPVANVARWDGNAWSSLGVGFDGAVSAIVSLANGRLVAGGTFTKSMASQPLPGLALWDGTAWRSIAGVVPRPSNCVGVAHYRGSVTVSAIHNMGGDRLLVGGDFAVTGIATNIALWDSTTSVWSGLRDGPGSATDRLQSVRTVTRVAGDRFVVAGMIRRAGDQDVSNVAMWNGVAWQALGSGFGGMVSATATLANGDLAVAGLFSQIGQLQASRIAIRRGGTWLPLGMGLASSSGVWVWSLLALPQGGLLVGGQFETAGGVAAAGLARWDGAAWSAVGGGLARAPGFEPMVTAMTHLPNGDLVVAGVFTSAGGVSVNNVARFDGAVWSRLGSGLPNAVLAFLVLPDGDLVAAGYDVLASGHALARWDGTTWSGFAPGLGATPLVRALAQLPSGDFVAGGFDLGPHGSLARWNGSAWSDIGRPSAGCGDVWALHVLPDGDLVVGGGFTEIGGAPISGVARYDGATWSPVGGNVQGPPNSSFTVASLTRLRNGDLVAGGDFHTVAGAPSAMLAQLTTPCAATVVAVGRGCTGASGAVALVADSLPWVGSTFRSSATGLPALSVAVAVRGVAPASIPLANVLPQVLVGCRLLVSPDLLDVHVPVAGSVQTSFDIPNTATLVGQVLRQQVVPVEFDALGNLVAVTSTNALLLTIGAF